ncbi:MAG: hypothetical protein VX453_06895 [Acidobacteriota bacterium]|nr:hypothetical protein [Acidobacteriota bacterium]
MTSDFYVPPEQEFPVKHYLLDGGNVHLAATEAGWALIVLDVLPV